MNANELAHKVFDALYDEDDLKELHEKKIIAQPLGYKISAIATIECEIQDEHDRLTSENARLRQALQQTNDSINRLFAVDESEDPNEETNARNQAWFAARNNEQILTELEKDQ